MIRTHSFLCSAIFSTLLASSFAAWADANTASAYALRAPLSTVADAPLQRLVLPADAVVRLQTNNYSDVRIFNAQGQSVPIALAQVAALTQTQQAQVKLSAYPILGAADTWGMLGNEGVSLRIEERQGKRVVQVDTSSAKAKANAKNIVGVLLDARAVKAPVLSITLDADLPVAQPITFDVQASKDLKNWRSLADTVLYRAADSASPSSELGTQRMTLAFSDLKDHYLRITWQGATDAATPITVRGATLHTSQSTSSHQRISASIATPALTSAHELSFALPFATPLAALKIKAPGVNVLIPVRVLGRNDRNQAWALLASTVLYNLTTNGKEQANTAIELTGSAYGAAYKEIKIEADKKTAGFSAAPEVSAVFEPTQVIFLASGAPPFTLAVGLSGAVSTYLPLSSLIPGYQSGQENTLPLARAEVTAAVANAPAISAQSPTNTPPTRSLVLWGVLLAGVVLLGLMAWALMKQAKSASASNE
jgi:Protein of unknown function (DUF3999)